MLTSGDVVRVDLGTPIGSEAGILRPAVVVTAHRVLSLGSRVAHVVPLTTSIRQWASAVAVPADVLAGLQRESAAQCQHIPTVSTARAWSKAWATWGRCCCNRSARRLPCCSTSDDRKAEAEGTSALSTIQL